MINRNLAATICAFMNDVALVDRTALLELINNRVPCSEALAKHPTVQVARDEFTARVGLLGILNGLCGVYDDDTGALCAVTDEDSLKFVLLDSDGTIVTDIEKWVGEGGAS